jgi:hypothetical protein
MKKYRNIEKVYGIIWAIIFGMVGGYLDSIGWSIIAWLFFGLSGMSIITIFRLK